MTNRNRRQQHALEQIRKICAAQGDTFRGNAVAERWLAQLDSSTDRAQAASADHAAQVAAERNATVARTTARGALRGALKAIAQTSPGVAIEAGDTARFTMPKGCSDVQLIDVAKDYAGRASQFAAAFAAHKLPASVIAELPAKIAALQRAMDDQSAARDAHKVARTVYVAALKSGTEAMDGLEPIHMNAFGGDTKAIGDWTAARRVGPTRRAEVEAPAAAPAPSPTKVA